MSGHTGLDKPPDTVRLEVGTVTIFTLIVIGGYLCQAGSVTIKTTRKYPAEPDDE
ncbi:MAG: hypothetical protein LUQ31_03830 [Methanoregula sp.]|nr:hypothetical protein [Methanoregula sp.]